jgi:hypothetical protein
MRADAQDWERLMTSLAYDISGAFNEEHMKLLSHLINNLTKREVTALTVVLQRAQAVAALRTRETCLELEKRRAKYYDPFKRMAIAEEDLATAISLNENLEELLAASIAEVERKNSE